MCVVCVCVMSLRCVCVCVCEVCGKSKENGRGGGH